VTVQVGTYVLQPGVLSQPVKRDPELGVAVSVTWVPVGNGAWQGPLLAPQLIPAGWLVIVPGPAV
jgi:hypothetical protein